MKEKLYKEEDLRKLVDLIDESYRGVTRNNTNGSEILEDFLLNGFTEEKFEEETISFIYSFLRRKLNKSDLEELSGGHETKDSDVFQLTEKQAKQFNLI